jgi:hypothetical protein
LSQHVTHGSKLIFANVGDLVFTGVAELDFVEIGIGAAFHQFVGEASSDCVELLSGACHRKVVDILAL